MGAVMRMKRLSKATAGLLVRSRNSQAGQAYTEYGLILVIIAIGVISTLMLMGHHVSNMYENVSTGLSIH